MEQAARKMNQRYEIRRRLAAEPTFDVFLAADREVGVDLALLRVRPEFLPRPRDRATFCQAAETARNFSHPNVHHILSSGEDDKGCYVAVQGFDGATMAERLHKGLRFDDEATVSVAMTLSGAFDEAHASGLIHGHLRPADVFLVGEFPKLFGVGLWYPLRRDKLLTAYGDDARYLAPEVHAARIPTVQSDVYSLAMVFGQMLAGGAKKGESASALVLRLEKTRPRLAPCISGALSSDPGARPDSVVDLVSQLVSGLRKSRVVVPLTAKNHPKDTRPVGNSVAHRSLTAHYIVVAIILLEVIAALVGVVLIQKNRARVRGQSAADGAGAGLAVEPLPITGTRNPCPPGMVLVKGDPAFCIDAYEAPGRGIIPVTNIALDEAKRKCEGQRKKLCINEEWERACRGRGGSSYPYGNSFVEDRCNIDMYRGKVRAAGSFPNCKSPAGAFDMSGNVSEWVDEGYVKGGSAFDELEGRCSHRGRRKNGTADAAVGYRCCADPGAQ